MFRVSNLQVPFARGREKGAHQRRQVKEYFEGFDR